MKIKRKKEIFKIIEKNFPECRNNLYIQTLISDTISETEKILKVKPMKAEFNKLKKKLEKIDGVEEVKTEKKIIYEVSMFVDTSNLSEFEDEILNIEYSFKPDLDASVDFKLFPESVLEDKDD